MLSGVAGFIVGAVLFSEWNGLGSFWVGLMAVGSGIAGVYITHNEPSGGTATVFFGLLSFATLVAATVSIMLGEGVAYLVVRETEGNCFESDACPVGSCGDDQCVCWEPDGSEGCASGSSLRYCIRYGGDRCSDIKATENLLLGSSVTIGIIALFSLCSVLVAINTCWFCKRVIVVDSNVIVDDQSAVFR
ncbi:unnamed protein product [Laminaria digitata]